MIHKQNPDAGYSLWLFNIKRHDLCTAVPGEAVSFRSDFNDQ